MNIYSRKSSFFYFSSISESKYDGNLLDSGSVEIQNGKESKLWSVLSFPARSCEEKAPPSSTMLLQYEQKDFFDDSCCQTTEFTQHVFRERKK